MPGGRPSTFTKGLATKICAEIARGKSLRSICAQPEMPHIATVLRWRDARPDFCEQYARARQDRVDYWSEEINDIADDGSNDWMEAEYGPQINHEHVTRSKLRVDTRRWLMSKMDPGKYGDKTQVAGADGTSPVTIVIRKFDDSDNGD
jgi:hypothetical protein